MGGKKISWTRASRAQRRELIDWEKREVPISTQAQLLGLNRSGLYFQPVPPSAREVTLKHRIDEMYTAHPYYGYRRIAAQLHREDLAVNPKTVAHYMQEMGLAAVYPGPNLSKRAQQAAIYPYLLGNAMVSAPNQVWGIDITYIRLRSSWMYAGFDPGLVLAVRGKPGNWTKPCRLASSWKRCSEHSRRPSHRFAIAKRRSQFTSPQYTQLLLAHDVRISMVSCGRALDNIFTERMFRTVKYEEVSVKEYSSPREAREGLSAYVRFYNEERLHQALEYGTPAEVYFAK